MGGYHWIRVVKSRALTGSVYRLLLLENWLRKNCAARYYEEKMVDCYIAKIESSLERLSPEIWNVAVKQLHILGRSARLVRQCLKAKAAKF